MRELALHILDILQNAVEAGATRVDLAIVEDAADDQLTVTVADNGPGIDPEALSKVTDPFYTSRKTRHVGLGLPLWAAAAERAGGKLTLSSAPGAGTTVTATFRLSHPDRQPLGDIVSTLMAFLMAEHPVDIHYLHRTARGTFEFDSADIRANLAGMPLGHRIVRKWLDEFLTEGEASIGCGG